MTEPSASPGNESVPRSSLLDDEFLAKLRRLQLVSKSIVSARTRGERRSRRRGFSNEFADYRDYSSGDDLRYLDWNIYGRLDRLFIKLFHEDDELRVDLIIDHSVSMAQGDPVKAGIALRVAAALGVIALSNGDRVTITPVSTRTTQVARGFRGRRSVNRMFAALESLEFTGETDIASALASAPKPSTRRGIAVLLSDLLDPGGIDPIVRAVTRRASEAYVVHILSPQDVDPEHDDEFDGDLSLLDSERSAKVEATVNTRLIDAYHSAVKAFRADAERCCRNRHVGYIGATSDMPFDRWVLDLLRRQRLVR